jgi:hypothetical protein
MRACTGTNARACSNIDVSIGSSTCSGGGLVCDTLRTVSLQASSGGDGRVFVAILL